MSITKPERSDVDYEAGEVCCRLIGAGLTEQSGFVGGRQQSMKGDTKKILTSKKILKKKEEQDLALYAMTLSSSSVLPMVLKTAIDLGLFDILAESGPSSVSKIVSLLSTQTGQHHESGVVERILRCLACYSIVTCSVSTDHGVEPRAVYGLAPVAKYFTTKNQDGGGSLAPLVQLFQDKVVVDIR